MKRPGQARRSNWRSVRLTEREQIAQTLQQRHSLPQIAPALPLQILQRVIALQTVLSYLQVQLMPIMLL